MDGERVRRSDPCSEQGCGSRRFYIADDGYTYCDRGHRQTEAGAVVTTETGELVATGRKSRRADSDVESIASTRSGFAKNQVDEHYLLCLQLILRKQVSWLIQERGFPVEFESIMKDLFALRIQHFHSVSAQGSPNDAPSQTFSSQSEGDAATDSEGTGKRQGHRSKGDDGRQHNAQMRVLDVIALVQVGILLLRLPVCTTDLCHWSSTGELLYYYSAKAIPVDLYKRLPEYARIVLSPQQRLTGELLQMEVSSTIRSFSTHDGMQVPAINHTVLLSRWLKVLCLPLEVYAGVRIVASALHERFEYVINSSTQTTRWPEIRLMALLVLTTTLLFPVEENGQFVTSSSSLSALQMDWHRWMRLHPDTEDVHKQNASDFQTMLATTETDCLKMEEAAMDQYLEWYEDNLLIEYIPEQGRAATDADFRRAMMDFFPISEKASNSNNITGQLRSKDHIGNSERLRHMQQCLMPRLVTHDDQRTSAATADMHRLGSRYRRYRTIEELQAGPEATLKLYELAAQQSGASIALLTRTIYALSRTLEGREVASANHDR